MSYHKVAYVLLISLILWSASGHTTVAAPLRQGGEEANACAALLQEGIQSQNDGQLQAALDAYRKAFQCYGVQGDISNQARSKISIGDVFREDDQYSVALDEYESGIDLYTDAGLPEADILTQLYLKRDLSQGDIFFNEKRYALALPNYLQALAASRKIVDWKLGASLYYRLGNTYYNQDRYAKALVNYRQALSMYRELGYPGWEAIILNSIGDALVEQNHPEAALGVYREAIGIWQELEVKVGEGQVLTDMGEAYVEMERQDDAINVLNTALSIHQAEATKDDDEAAYTLYFLGQAYNLKGDSANAEAYYSQSTELYAALQRDVNAVVVLEQVADAQREQRNYAEAKNLYQRAADKWAQTPGNGLNVSENLAKIGDILIKVGKYPEAAEVLQQAIDAPEDDWVHMPALTNMGRVELARGNYNEALTLFQRAADLYRRVNNRTAEADNLNYLGQAQYALGDYNDAADSFREALAIGRRYAGAEMDEIEAHINLGQLYLTLGLPEEAAEWLDEAGALLENQSKAFDHLRVDLLTAQGQLALVQQNYDEAQTSYTEAGKFIDENDVLATSNLLNRRAEVYLAQDYYKQAKDAYDEARELREQANIAGNPQQAETYLGLGDVYLAKAQYDNAWDSYQQALTIYKNNKAGQGRTLNRLGQWYEHQGQYPEAIGQYKQALDLSQEGDDRLEQSRILLNIARVLEIEGNFDQALSRYQQALFLFQRIGAPLREAEVYLGWGNVLATQARYKEALEQYELALDKVDPAVTPSLAIRAETLLGQTYLQLENESQTTTDQLENESQATDHLEKALNLTELVADKTLEAEVRLGLGNLYQIQGDPDAAITEYGLAKSHGSAPQQTTALYELGRVYLAQTQDNPDAARDARDAYELARPMVDPQSNRIEAARIFFGLGQAYEALGDTPKAIDYYLQAITPLEQVRATASNQAARAEFIAQFADLYTRLAGLLCGEGNEASFPTQADLLCEEGNVEAALFISELGRARTFSDALVTGSVQLADEDEQLQALLADERKAFNALTQAENALSQARSSNRADTDADLEAIMARARQEVTEQQQRINEAEADLSAKQKEYNNSLDEIDARRQALADEAEARLGDFSILLESDDNLTLEQITERGQALVADTNALLVSSADGEESVSNTALLSYYILENQTLVFLIGEGKIEAHRISVTRQDLQQQITALRNMMTDADGDITKYQEKAKKLYELLLGTPFDNKLQENYTQLIIVPHGELHYLPFAALVNSQNEYLMEKFSLANAPSVSSLALIQKNAKGIPNVEDGLNMLAMGRESFTDEGLDPLRGVKSELDTVTQVFGGPEPLRGGEATESAFYDKARHAHIIHLATHAVYDGKDPLNSTIYLTGDAHQDGRLQVREIYNLHLNTELAVLSACQTNVGSLTAGDDVVGLTHAFLSAQVPTVVASLWPVDDTATSMLMQNFYENLRVGQGKAEALKNAQATVRDHKNYSHPAYWAAFVLSGDGGKPSEVITTTVRFGVRDRGNRLWLTILGILVLAVVGGAVGGTAWYAQKTGQPFPVAAQQVSEMVITQAGNAATTFQTKTGPMLKQARQQTGPLLERAKAQTLTTWQHTRAKTGPMLKQARQQTGPLLKRAKAAMIAAPQKIRALPSMWLYALGGGVGIVVLLLISWAIIGHGPETPHSQAAGLPIAEVTEEATQEATVTPLPTETETPTPLPTETPTLEPTATPTLEPTEVPTQEPTAEPTDEPTEEPLDPLRQLQLWGPSNSGQIDGNDNEQWFTFYSGKETEATFLAFVRNAGEVDISIFDGNQIPRWPHYDPNSLNPIGRGNEDFLNRDRDSATREFLWTGPIQRDTTYYIRFINRGGSTLSYCIQTQPNLGTCP